jgi:hypothetical protein
MEANIKIINVPTLSEYAQISSNNCKVKQILNVKHELDRKFNLYLRYGIKGLFDK